MPTTDFNAWIAPNLDIPLAGVTYSIAPPSVAKARIILAFAVLSEHQLGIADGDPDPELVALADAQEDTLAVVTLGRDVYDRMVEDGVAGMTIDRVGFYAMHYWARGKAGADYLAAALWSPTVEAVEGAAPKGRKRSRNGRSTA